MMIVNEELINKIITYNYNDFGNEFGDALVDLQKENARLKDKIENATKLIEEIKLHYQQSPTMIPNVKINKLEDLLKEN